MDDPIYGSVSAWLLATTLGVLSLGNLIGAFGVLSDATCASLGMADGPKGCPTTDRTAVRSPFL